VTENTPQPAVAAATTPWGWLLPWLMVGVSGMSGPLTKTSSAEISEAVSKAVAPLRDDLKEIRSDIRDLDKRTTRLEAGKK